MDILVMICNSARESCTVLCDYVEKFNLEKFVTKKRFNEFYIQLVDGTRLYAVPYSLYHDKRWYRGRDYIYCGKHFRSGYVVKDKESE